jgi:hypothetical protein
MNARRQSTPTPAAGFYKERGRARRAAMPILLAWNHNAA